MHNLLSYITDGLEVTREIPIFVDRASLIEFKRLETEISKTVDAERLEKLQALQDELRTKITESQITVKIHLPSKDARHDLSLKVMSEFGLTGEEDYEPRPEFYEEVTIRSIHLALTEIDSPTGTEKDVPLDAFRAFKDAVASVPANWNAIVDAFNDLVASEVIYDMEFRSADFS